jgi:platelet-activating factor acetylhydrolase IB subunit alpha
MGGTVRAPREDFGSSLSCSVFFFFDVIETVKTGHDGWIRGFVFHPTGKFLISVSDDKSMRVWDLESGRCTRTLQAHSHFVSCVAWAAASERGGGGGGAGGDAGSAGGAAAAQGKRVNVVATGGIDRLVKIWTP